MQLGGVPITSARRQISLLIAQSRTTSAVQITKFRPFH